jgi:hypothetical protein
MAFFFSRRRRPQTIYLVINNSSTLYIYGITGRHTRQFQLHIKQYYTVRNIEQQRTRSSTDLGFSQLAIQEPL